MPLRFPGPPGLLRDHNDDAFGRLTLAAISGDWHNPWPELVTPELLTVPGAHPLLRLWYLPQLPSELPAWRTEFDERRLAWPALIGAYHEAVHVSLDFTPAKEWMRICLARLYQHGLLPLLTDDGDGEARAAESWATFQALAQQLQQTFDQIVLAEELLATSVSLHAAQQRYPFTPKQKQEIVRLQAQVVGARRRDFRRLYPAFEHVAELVASAPDLAVAAATLGRLALFLQPISLTGEKPSAAESNERCRRLAKSALGYTSVYHLADWLEQQLGDPQEVDSWREIFGRAVEESRGEAGYFLRVLWGMTHGVQPDPNDDPVAIATGVIERSFNWRSPHERDDWDAALLIPVERADQWHIEPIIGAGLPEGYSSLLALDAYRQQLTLGAGAACPFYDGEGCRCRDSAPGNGGTGLDLGGTVLDARQATNTLAHRLQARSRNVGGVTKGLRAVCRGT